MLTNNFLRDRLCRRQAFFVCAIFLIISGPAFAQPVSLHCDLGLHYSHFRATELPGISDGRPGVNIRMGFAYHFGTENRFSFGAEAGVYVRRMERSMDDYGFTNRFSTFETPVFFRGNLNEHWSAEAGVAFLFTRTTQSGLRNSEADTRIRVGRGFQSFDVAPFIGGTYRFSEHLSVGGRAKLGLLPMVEYQTVGDFGSINPVQTDLYCTTFEVFLRISTF